MNKLIITADDYGMCGSVNQAIETCIEAKVVLSTNVMANMEAADMAAQLKQKYPYASIGLHYNFTVGRPILPANQVPSLINEHGEFLSYPEIRKKCNHHTYNFEEIAAEMEAQFKRFVEICGEPDYWNTHENVHVYPGLYQMFRDKSLEFGIHMMRTHRRIYVPASGGKSDKSLIWTITNPIKQRMLTSWQASSQEKGIYAPDGLLVRMNEEDKLNLPYLFTHIRWKSAQIAEIAIHPSIDGNNRYFGEITEQRVREYECFSNPEVLKIATEANIKITGFDVVHRCETLHK